MERAYTDLFFDLDRTLWDFDTNSRTALYKLYHVYNLQGEGIGDPEHFVIRYQKINELLWAQYRMGKIQKAKLRRMRFTLALQEFGCRNKELGVSLDRDYIKESPYQTALMPGALETLTYLSERYKLHIITNGFEEVQHIKLENSKLKPFFEVVITSEKAQARKPNPAVFKLALKYAKAQAISSLMIGDDLAADIIGAKNYNMDQVFFNPEKIIHEEKPTFEVAALEELKLIL